MEISLANLSDGEYSGIYYNQDGNLVVAIPNSASNSMILPYNID